MNLKFFSCAFQKYPKLNLLSSKRSSKSPKKRKKRSSRSHRSRPKPTYVSANLSRNFYPANYFFQEEPTQHQKRLQSLPMGVNQFNHLPSSKVIARNTPTLAQQQPLIKFKQHRRSSASKTPNVNDLMFYGQNYRNWMKVSLVYVYANISADLVIISGISVSKFLAFVRTKLREKRNLRYFRLEGVYLIIKLVGMRFFMKVFFESCNLNN